MNKLVALDGGHHLTTSGKETPYIPELGRIIKEFEFNNAVVQLLDKELKRCGIDTIQVFSQYEDTSLFDRVEKANKANADIFISIHYNALTGDFNSTAKGLEIHSYPNSVNGKRLASNILNYLKGGTSQNNRGLKESNFYVLRETKMPSILSENGFMDNKREALLMTNEAFQKEVAVEHAKGICAYLGVTYEQENDTSTDISNFVTLVQLQHILQNYVKKEVVSVDRLKWVNKFDSNIYYYETNTHEFVDVDLGVRFEKETVSKIVKDKKAILGINGGFFGASKASEHIGLLIDEGLYYNPPNSDFIEFIYYKSGVTKIVNMAGYDKKVLSELQNNAHWAIGTSYSLVQNGKINLLNADKFAHSKSKQPRTMLGQKFDHTFILVVADGRSATSKGLAAQEQAQLMLELGCYNAVNLDGGGSSAMVYKDKLINKPSDGSERKVGSVILVKGV